MPQLHDGNRPERSGCGGQGPIVRLSGQTVRVVVPKMEGSMAGKFELYKDAKGKFRFRYQAGTGEIIAVGESYETKANANNGIASAQKNTPDAPVVDLTE